MFTYFRKSFPSSVNIFSTWAGLSLSDGDRQPELWDINSCFKKRSKRFCLKHAVWSEDASPPLVTLYGNLTTDFESMARVKYIIILQVVGFIIKVFVSSFLLIF